jgi:hypothetical protein
MCVSILESGGTCGAVLTFSGDPPSKEAAGPPFVSGRFAPTLHRPFLLPLASPNAFLAKEFSEVCLPHPWLRFGFRSRCGRVTQDA